MVTTRQTAPIGTRPDGNTGRASTALGYLCAAAMICVSACADIWGFGELRSSPDGGGSAGTTPVLASGGAGGGRQADPGTGGTPTATGSGGAAGQGGVLGQAGSGGGPSRSGGGGGATGGAAMPPATGGTSGPGSGGSGAGGGVSGSGGSGGSGGRLAGSGGGPGPVGSGGMSPPPASGGASAPAGSGGLSAPPASGGTPGTVTCLPGTSRCVSGDIQTCSATGIWQSTGTATRELLTNRAFEGGETGWFTSVAGGFPVVYAADGSAGNSPAVVAQSPPNVAWMAGYTRADDVLSQAVVLPANATSMNVSFYYAIFTNEETAAENDVMDVQLIAGAQIIPLAHFSDNNAVQTWTRFAAAVPSSLAGQTVTLQFHDTTNATLLTSFYIDTVSLQVVACP